MNIVGILNEGCNKGILIQKGDIFQLTKRGRKVMRKWSEEKSERFNVRPEKIMSYLAINFPEARELSPKPPKHQSFFKRKLNQFYTRLYRPFQYY